VTFKDLKKKVSLEATQQQSRLFERLQNKPFWIWNIEEHKQEDIKTNGDCCFNHIIGLPSKDTVDKPLYDYEQIIFDCLITQDDNNNSNSSNKHLWIKKATGLGISEFMLRFMAWLCLNDNALAGSQMCIVTGPRIDLAIALIDRMKKLFSSSRGLATIFDTKETVIDLNGVKIEAFPSHHLDAMRGLPNVSFILLDEADFFPLGQQQDARDVSERYIAKSNPYIVMVSTPNAPEGLFERIEKEPEDTCLYKRIFLDYTYGISKIYTAEEIEKAKQSPSFEREYNLKYLGRIGNVFHTKDIEAAIEKGRKYNPDNFNPYYSFTSRSMGIDPAYGSSAFGIVVTQFEDGIVQIMHAEEYHRPDYNEMLSLVYGLMSKYNVDSVYIDGANPSFIKSLKLQIGEDPDYDKVIARYRSDGLGDSWTQDMKIIPVNFNKEHKAMLGHCKTILENEPRKIAINPIFDKLITALRTAVDNDGTLDKEVTSYNDILDAFRLALKFYRFQEKYD
jgi:Terminase RNaseH-like domain